MRQTQGIQSAFRHRPIKTDSISTECILGLVDWLLVRYYVIKDALEPDRNLMSKSGKKDLGKTMKPGQKSPVSGEYEIIGPRGGDTGHERSVVRGKPLPPIPKSGRSYTLRAKSGRYIIESPAKSAISVSTWSKAFKTK
jgi:hypothetical protein